MSELLLLDTVNDTVTAPLAVTPDKPQVQRNELADYWRARYDAIRAESVAATITSLRSELRTIKALAAEGGEDALKRIGFHARLALELKEGSE